VLPIGKNRSGSLHGGWGEKYGSQPRRRTDWSYQVSDPRPGMCGTGQASLPRRWSLQWAYGLSLVVDP
jgi:hypothetical protein